jgi:hypothetical protein
VDVNFDSSDQFFHGYLLYPAGMRHSIAINVWAVASRPTKPGAAMAAEAKARK